MKGLLRFWIIENLSQIGTGENLNKKKRKIKKYIKFETFLSRNSNSSGICLL